MPFKSVKATMDEWKSGNLHSGSKSGPVVRSQKQAVAIALSEKRKAGTPGLGHVRHKLRVDRADAMPKDPKEGTAADRREDAKRGKR